MGEARRAENIVAREIGVASPTRRAGKISELIIAMTIHSRVFWAGVRRHAAQA